MYTKLNLLPAKIASKSSIRGDFQHVMADGIRTVATDTFRLLEVTTTVPEKHDPLYILADVAKKHKMPSKQIALDIKELQANPHINTYPDIDKVIAEKSDIEYISTDIDAAMLGELLTTMSKMNRFATVRIKVPCAKGHAVHLYAVSDDKKQQAHGLQMPTNRNYND